MGLGGIDTTVHLLCASFAPAGGGLLFTYNRTESTQIIGTATYARLLGRGL